METPKKVRVREGPDGPVFTYYWRDWGFLYLGILFFAFFFLLPLYFLVDWLPSLSQDAMGLGFFLLFFVGLGLGLNYWAWGKVINRSEIRLQNGRLIVRHKPLPWRYSADLPVDQICSINRQEYYVESRDTFQGGGLPVGFSIGMSFRNDRLVVGLRDGKQRILIPKIELAAAEFLGRELAIRLGYLPEMPAVDKAQALKTEQKKEKMEEARQARQLMPFLIIFSVVFAAFGVWLLIDAIMEQREGQASLTWPAARAQVVEYFMETRTEEDSSGFNHTTFTPIVHYRYIIEGKPYIYEYHGASASTEEAAARQFEGFPLGMTREIYYNPDQPGRARLTRGASDPTMLYWFAFFLIVVAPAILLGVTVLMGRWICKVEGCPEDWKHLPFWRAQVPLLNRF